MFQFDESYERPSNPQAVRNDFYDLTREFCLDPQDLLDRLAATLSADQLAEFMDDLAMGRV